MIYIYLLFHHITIEILAYKLNNNCLNNDFVYIASILPYLPKNKFRDERGRFIKNNEGDFVNPLPNYINDPLTGNMLGALTGNMLGDGHLRFTHKDKSGKR